MALSIYNLHEVGFNFFLALAVCWYVLVPLRLNMVCHWACYEIAWSQFLPLVDVKGPERRSCVLH
jgi:hypothetical protein